MADSIRQDIVDALTTLFATVLTTGGYETNAGQRVYPWRTDFNELEPAKLPALCFYDTEDVWEVESMPSRYRHTLTVVVEGLASGTTSAATARKLIKDIHTVMGTNRKLSGLLEWSEPKSDRLISREAQNNITACQVTFEFVYTTSTYGTT